MWTLLVWLQMGLFLLFHMYCICKGMSSRDILAREKRRHNGGSNSNSGSGIGIDMGGSGSADDSTLFSSGRCYMDNIAWWMRMGVLRLQWVLSRWYQRPFLTKAKGEGEGEGEAKAEAEGRW